MHRRTTCSHVDRGIRRLRKARASLANRCPISRVASALTRLLLWFVTLATPIAAIAHGSQSPAGLVAPTAARSSIWREPTAIQARDLFDGAGGKERRPTGRLSFLKEETDGTKPKFLVVDERGVRWKVKLGSEAQPEVAATRLVWAVGYFVDENYYEAEMTVANLPRLRRGQKYVSADGVVHGARIERDEHADKKIGEWNWFENPYVGTRELNGLRVLMALINNWDTGPENNSIRARQGVAEAYYVGDLGSSFGRAHGRVVPSRNDLKDYSRSSFIRRVTPDRVVFNFRSCFAPFSVLYPRIYRECRHDNRVGHAVPIEDVRWITTLLKQLSFEQIADAFRAAGYTAEEVDGYARVVSQRVSILQGL